MDSETKTPTAAQTAEMVEIRPAGAKGNGLFAKVDIPIGTRILAEEPLIVIPFERSQQFTKFVEAAKSMPDKMAILDSLHCNPALLDEHQPGNIISQVREDGFDPAADPDMMRRFGIYRTNCVDMSSRKDEQEGLLGQMAGLCPLYSHMNHSCVPNVYFSWNERLGCEVVQAGRDLAAGEELLCNYLGSDATFMTRAQRDKRIQRYWGFVCDCPACADEDADDERGELAWLEGRLVEIDYSPEAAAEGLEVGQELVDLIQAAGLGGNSLCAVYQDCSKYSLVLGDEQAAIRFAKLNLETQKLVMGSDAVDSEWITTAGLEMPEE